MEFTYRISETDYVRAMRAATKMNRFSLWKIVVFWILIVVGLTLMFEVISQNRQISESQTQSQADSENPPDSPPSQSIWVPVAKECSPLVGILACWALIIFVGFPYLIRRKYRKDLNVHGDITVKIDPQSFELRTAGSLVQSRWNVFKAWAEKKDMVLIQYHSGLSHIIIVSGLNGEQRTEMRQILSGVLPKR